MAVQTCIEISKAGSGLGRGKTVRRNRARSNKILTNVYKIQFQLNIPNDTIIQ
jgi:hypothetical protein